MASPLLDFSHSQGTTEGDYICAECGEGFGHYQKLINHMAIHGPIDPVSANDKADKNGRETPIEFALHENGTLTVVDKSAVSNFSFLFGKPTSKPLVNQSPQDPLPSNNIPEKEYIPCRCERCGQVFRNQKNLQQHQRYRPLEQGFKCTLCCKVYYDRESLRVHLQSHDQERFYSCGHCGKRFLKQETLFLHQKEWHRSPGSKSLLDSNKFEDDHENGVDKSYPCRICGLRFFWLSDLQSHLMSHSHANKLANDAKQKENMRDQEESNPKKNVPHSTDDSIERTYRCGLCGGCFASLAELKLHHVTEHPEDEQDENEEDSSGSSSPVKRQPVNYHGIMRQMVSKHQMQRMDPLRSRIRGRPRGNARGSHSTKVFPCKQCHRVFVHSSSLSRHMRYHKGTLHTCLYCGRHFPQRCDVTRHVAMYHSDDVKVKLESETLEGEDKNDADELSKMQTSDDLDNHENHENHENQENEDQNSATQPDNEQSPENPEAPLHKPRMTYRCKECGRVFGLLSVYQRHVRYHRRDPSRVLLSCPHCPCRFSFRSALDRHLENHDKVGTEDNGKEGPPAVEALKVVEKCESKPDTKEKTPSDVLYECTECTQTFSDLQRFLQHQSAHG